MNPHFLGQLKENVTEYALKKGLIKPIEKIDARVKGKFLLSLGFHGLIPKREPFHGDTVIMEHIEMFLDWYFFEMELKKGKTVAELYVKSREFKRDFRGVNVKKMEKAVKRLKNPLWGYFVVCEKGKKDEYNVKPLGGGNVYTIHDESSFPHVREGDVFLAKLHPFGGKYYASGRLFVVPPEVVEKYCKFESLLSQLKKVFDEFLERKVPERIKGDCREMYEFLEQYVGEEEYTTLEEVKALNAKKSVRWLRKTCEVSSSFAEEYETMVTTFLAFLKDNPEM